MLNGTPLYNLDYFSCITTNAYFKALVVVVFGLVITFVDEIDVMHSKLAFVGLLFLALLFSWTHLEELGAVILMLVLLVLVFNIQYNKKELEN
jgi:hypothetical protein